MLDRKKVIPLVALALLISAFSCRMPWQPPTGTQSEAPAQQATATLQPLGEVPTQQETYPAEAATQTLVPMVPPVATLQPVFIATVTLIPTYTPVVQLSAATPQGALSFTNLEMAKAAFVAAGLTGQVEESYIEGLGQWYQVITYHPPAGEVIDLGKMSTARVKMDGIAIWHVLRDPQGSECGARNVYLKNHSLQAGWSVVRVEFMGEHLLPNDTNCPR